MTHPDKMAVISPLSAVTNRFEDGDVPFDIQAFIDEALAIIDETEIKERSAQA